MRRSDENIEHLGFSRLLRIPSSLAPLEWHPGQPCDGATRVSDGCPPPRYEVLECVDNPFESIIRFFPQVKLLIDSVRASPLAPGLHAWLPKRIRIRVELSHVAASPLPLSGGLALRTDRP